MTNKANLLKLEILTSSLCSAIGWYQREVDKYEFHPVIKKVLEGFTPSNLTLLLLEHPHIALTDPQRIAYTRDYRSGVEDRQTLTTFGRYIRNHFPDLKDHEVRDYTALCVSDTFEIWDTSDLIVKSVQHGPGSCMQWEPEFDHDQPASLYHPYRVYDPAYGWRAAVRMDKDRNILGRALINVESNTFVRSFKRGTDYSYTDESLEIWLKEQGFNKSSSWSGHKLKYRENRWGDLLAPYIDGDAQMVDLIYSSGQESRYLCICEQGEYECTSTDGSAEQAYPQSYCECCGEYRNEDDFVEVRYYSSETVCDSCADYYFREALTVNGRYRLIHEDDIIETVCGTYVHSEYMEDNDVIQLSNGDYAFKTDDIYFCEGSQEFYQKEVDPPVVVEGLFYHPDYAPENESTD